MTAAALIDSSGTLPAEAQAELPDVFGILERVASNIANTMQ